MGTLNLLFALFIALGMVSSLACTAVNKSEISSIPSQPVKCASGFEFDPTAPATPSEEGRPPSEYRRFVRFVGVTYNDEFTSDRTICKSRLPLSNVTYLSSIQNDYVRMYISAKRENRLRIENAKHLPEVDDGKTKSIDLCYEIECGLVTGSFEATTFTIADDLDAGERFVDRMLMDSVLAKLPSTETERLDGVVVAAHLIVDGGD